MSQEEFMRQIEKDRDHWDRISTQLMGHVARAGFYLMGRSIRGTFINGGAYMEMFLRYNFGVRYFPVGFSLFTTAALGGSLIWSGMALLVSPAVDPGSLFSALSVFIASILFAIPWTIHGISILRRGFRVTDQHSQYSGDSWLDYFNERLQNYPAAPEALRRTFAWLCRDTLQRDFVGETAMGIGIAYIVGSLSFSVEVTNFLLASLVLMQIKRGWLLMQKRARDQQLNDGRIDMERRQSRSF
jgi:membrane protein implicated in regulation of membrane protease activity